MDYIDVFSHDMTTKNALSGPFFQTNSAPIISVQSINIFLVCGTVLLKTCFAKKVLIVFGNVTLVHLLHFK